jgi:hypothetical protein
MFPMSQEDATHFIREVNLTKQSMARATVDSLPMEFISPLYSREVAVDGAPVEMRFREHCRFTAVNEQLNPTHISLVEVDGIWRVCTDEKSDSCRQVIADVVPGELQATQQNGILTLGPVMAGTTLYLRPEWSAAFIHEMESVTGADSET